MARPELRGVRLLQATDLRPTSASWLLATLAVTLLLAGCEQAQSPTALDRLHPCTSSEGPTDAYCGTHTVFENRAAGSGRQLALRIIVLPALSHKSRPDPLVFLAGGPGQGAAELAPQVRQLFRHVLRERDIVLVDQRGTGKSHPLECRSDSHSLTTLNERDEDALARLRRCLDGYDADVRFYTTPVAMDDLDEVREFLGYEQVNVYGGSYGTRAALVYLRQHEPHVRTVILDGVAPPDMSLPLFAARDAQRALNAVLTACDEDAGCRERFPRLLERTQALLASLSARPRREQLIHPRTGAREEVEIDARLVAAIVLGALYSPSTASMLPALLDRAEQHDFQALLALGLAGDVSDGISVGMQLSVICSEDAPRVTAADVEREAVGTIFMNAWVGQTKACEFWPKGEIDATYYQPVASQVPVLILSGDADPVTPPSWGAAVASHLPRSRHFIAPATGHGVIGTACGLRVIRDFLDRGVTDGLDGSCFDTRARPPFFLSPAGPDPMTRRLAIQ